MKKLLIIAGILLGGTATAQTVVPRPIDNISNTLYMYRPTKGLYLNTGPVYGWFQIPTMNDIQALGTSYQPAGNYVNSFNGRYGLVVPTTGDYSYAQISGTPTNLSQFTNGPGYYKANDNPTFGVGTFTGGITATQGSGTGYGGNFINTLGNQTIRALGYGGGSGGGAGIVARTNTTPTASGDRLAFLLGGAENANLNGGGGINSTGFNFLATQPWTAGSAYGSQVTIATTPNNSITRRDITVFDQDGSVHATQDNAFTSGTASFRWATTYTNNLQVGVTGLLYGGGQGVNTRVATPNQDYLPVNNAALTGAPTAPTPAYSSNGQIIANQSYVYNAIVQNGRGHISLTGSVTAALNMDYLNNTTSTYTITVPPTAGFATDGSSIITALNINTGTIRISCPAGYTISTPSGAVTPNTGYASISQYQKIQLIPIGNNAWYIQPLNGSITVQ